MSSLRDVLDAAAATLDGVDVEQSADGGTTWATHGTVFTILAPDGSTASFLLDPIVANAAARTPDVTKSTRRPGWVELRPRDVDGHAADRAGAWFLSGHRRLTGPGA
jgi:hypothetical protein